MGAVRKLSVGAIECWLLSDGTTTYEPAAMFANVSPADLEPALRGSLDADGLIPSTFHCLLIRSDGRVALVDAGLGDIGGPDSGLGMMPDSLREAGVEPDDVDTVIVSHGHPDHIGGLTVERDGARVLRFARARHHLWRTEWEFWTQPDLDGVPEMMRSVARTTFPLIDAAGLVVPVEDEADVLPGVRLVPAPGHTPGHAAVAVTSGDAGLLYLADAVVHRLHVEHPEWMSAFDAIPEATVRTRRLLFERAARAASPVVAFHIGYGRVERNDGGYRFDPA
jgi:glyoxylase-like metal-dependent hydrolase (beta-lactamase superfamily II)